ncbi:MAG: Acetylornithine deacetylase [uncultured Thermomicrobiales bacterium]|uniref:Acetylornithine deacetylase n=1 Tax=uncultured Thermomicrobiales bacterium TaxID=1645740 RepID=A0A6J4VC87_9BACT|nr:MAG: Acetylornithine deacetylase [uncultured Thermomicrobiales bacterium]
MATEVSKTGGTIDWDAVFALVEAKEGALIERLRRIIRVDNCIPPGKNYDTLVDLLEPQFKQYGFATERVVIPEELWRAIPLPLEGERVNLVAKKGSGKPPLTIYAHMDTVPIEEGWDYDPFGAELHDGRVYGRGVADMKGTIASLLTAAEIMDELGLEPVWDLVACLCTDEEIGVYPGIWHLAKEGYVVAPVLCMEGSQDPVLRLGSNGAVDVTITVKGRSCHSGANYLGVNAIEEAVPVMVELLALKGQVEARRSALPLAPAPGAPDHLRPMFNLDIIHAGVKSNIVPATCTLVVNRRFIPEERYEDVEREVREAVDRGMEKSRALDVEVSFMKAYPAYHQSADHPLAHKLVSIMKHLHGYSDADFVRTGSGGSTDMANVAETLGTDQIATVGLGRMGESKAHGANESVRLSDAKVHVKELLYLFCAPEIAPA